jgi:hypothetical protein
LILLPFVLLEAGIRERVVVRLPRPSQVDCRPVAKHDLAFRYRQCSLEGRDNILKSERSGEKILARTARGNKKEVSENDYAQPTR